VKVVLDANVLLAGFATRGLCEAVLEACVGSHEIIISEPILTEVRRHLSGKFRAPAGRVAAIESLLRENSAMVRPAKVPSGACRDPSDLAVLGTALAGGADCLVTGDRDLLDLGEFRGIRILSPRAFHDRML
jgi:putative PIN family toxin of toxin-antitoxin system